MTGYLNKPPLGIQVDRTHPLAQGIIHCWALNENSGVRCNNLINPNNHGTMTNFEPMSSVRGWYGASSGTAIRNVRTPETSIGCGNIPSTLQGTMEAWIVPEDWTNTQAIMAGTNEAGANTSCRYTIIAISAGCPLNQWLTIIGNGTTSQTACSGQSFDSTNFPAGKLAQLVVTYDNSKIKFYKDGQLINTVDQTVSAVGDEQPYRIGTLGAYSGGTNYFFVGIISLIRIYNIAKSATDIQRLYSQSYSMFKFKRQ